MGLELRDVRDDDADGLAALIGAIYAEYPGCVLDLDGVDRDLTTRASHVAERDGRFWVVEDGDGLIVACVGYAPVEVDGQPGVELERLYVAASQRGLGLGTGLVERVETAARDLDRAVVELWSDTRFVDAHRLYERLGYQRQPETRDLHDPSDSTEYHYLKHLT